MRTRALKSGGANARTYGVATDKASRLFLKAFGDLVPFRQMIDSLQYLEPTEIQELQKQVEQLKTEINAYQSSNPKNKARW